MMTLLSLTACCRLLAIDPKTFRRWLAAAQLTLSPHPTDGRSKGLCPEQLSALALAHRRTLAPWQTQPPPEPATSQPEPTKASPPPAPALPESDRLAALSAQVVAVQEQLSRLSSQLEQLVPPANAGSTPPPVLWEGRPVANLPAIPPAVSEKQEPMQEPRPRPPARVLPLVEYGRDGHYVVICPQEGRLGFEPDSQEWFAWLESRSSFRFVGKAGRFTAHRESERLPNAVWRAHRKIRNHTYNQRLAHTPGLSSSVLEQAAATLQAHLK